MDFTNLIARLSTLGRALRNTLFCVLAIALVWQGAFISSSMAMPLPQTNLIAVKDAGDQVKGKAGEDAVRAKGFIQDTKDAVKRTANKNADRVERASGNDGSFVERKANRDAVRIEQRANQDAARTQKAVDKTKNAIDRTVEGIKDAFN